jgi:uncharacterized iron-regulated membrane protein
VNPLRRIVFWLHLKAGLAAGSIVFIMSVTGVLLTYEQQVASWSDTRLSRVAPAGTRLRPDDLIAAARAAAGGTVPTRITVWSDPTAAFTIDRGTGGQPHSAAR